MFCFWLIDMNFRRLRDRKEHNFNKIYKKNKFKDKKENHVNTNLTFINKLR